MGQRVKFKKQSRQGKTLKNQRVDLSIYQISKAECLSEACSERRIYRIEVYTTTVYKIKKVLNTNSIKKKTAPSAGKKNLWSD